MFQICYFIELLTGCVMVIFLFTINCINKTFVIINLQFFSVQFTMSKWIKTSNFFNKYFNSVSLVYKFFYKYLSFSILKSRMCFFLKKERLSYIALTLICFNSTIFDCVTINLSDVSKAKFSLCLFLESLGAPTKKKNMYMYIKYFS